MIKSSLIFSACLAFNLSAAASSGSSAPDYPSCTDYRGMHVQYIPTDDLRKFNRHNTSIAITVHMESGAPAIVFHEPTLKKSPAVFRKFVLAHECEHHKNGDVGRHATVSEEEFRMTEERADCGALRSLGYGPREIEIIARTSERLNPPIKTHGGSISWSQPDRRQILLSCL